VSVIKAKTAYQMYSATIPKNERLSFMPQTPPPDDLTVSTRKWRHELHVWDVSLKAWHAGTTYALL
jgi:hypothetical protein